MAEETVLIRFKGEDEASSVANEVNQKVDSIGGKAGQVGGSFTKMGSVMTGVLQGVGQAIGGFVTDMGGRALGAVSDFVSGSIQEASQWDSVFAQTEAVIASTGAAAGVTAEDMANLAGSLSASAGASLFSDDAILGAQNLLATFTNIKEDTFADATLAVTNMSQAMGTDLNTAAMQVGKALNDPVAGLAALSRSGVQFTDEQENMIKSMVEAGNVAGAQQIMLQELETQFGGSAAAAVNTYAGQQVVLAEKMNDIKQTLGGALMPILMQFGSFMADTVVPIIAYVVGRIAEWITTTNESGVIATVFDTIRGAIAAVPGIIAELGVYFGMLAAWFQPIMDAAMNFIGIYVPILQQAGDAVMQYFASPLVQSLITSLMSLFSAAAQLIQDVLVAAFGLLGQAWTKIAELFTQYWPQIQTVLNTLVSAATIAVNFVTGLFTALSQLVKGDFAGAWTTLKDTAGKALGDLWKFCQELGKNLLSFMADVRAKFAEVGTNIAEGIASGITSAASAIKTAALDAAKNAFQAVKDFFGIASPSQLMHDMVGVNISRGIATGIMAGIPDVTTAADLAAASGAQTVNNYNFSASYANTQSESSLISDARAMMVSLGAM